MKSIPVLLSLLALHPTSGEHRRFDGPINAASNYVHYSEGYIVTPGYVDVSNLVFSSSADNGSNSNKLFSGKARDEDWNDEEMGEVAVDDDAEYDDDADYEGDDDGGRRLDGEDEGGESGSTFVDIVLFHEPPECANTRFGCDWTELGVGANDGVGNLRWCCSDDAAALGLCRGGPKQEGRLIVDPQKFTGQHRFLGVPPSGDWQTTVKTGRFDLMENQDGAGKYVLVVANCNDVIGRNLTVTGQYTWKSVHGYLPGNLFGEMYFFFGVVICYVILFLWYGFKMNLHKEEMIPIQKWVLSTIGIGLLESFFKAGDLWVWNIDGERFWFSLYAGVIFGVLKRAISRCLVVMLSLGWGVTCDTLGGKMKKLVVLGLVYAGVSAARDVMTVLAITENEILSQDEENEILDVVTILTFVAAFVDVTFYLWIFDALNGTMQFLEGMNQTMKMKRYLRLRFILLLSVLFAVLWSVFGIVDSYNDQRMVNEEENGWVLSAVWEVNYLLVLVGLSCLWAPEAGAKEYAYVMELSSMGGDLEFDTNIGGPDDDDDDDENGEEGVSGSDGYSDDMPREGGFKDDEDDLEVDKGVKA